MMYGRLRVVDVLSVVFGVVMIAMATVASESRSVTIAFICGVFCILPTVLKVTGLVELPTPLVCMITAAAFLHGLGLVTDMYTYVSFYDTLTHTLSSMTVGIIVFYAMMCCQYYGRGRVNFTGWGLGLFTAMITMAFSVYWEVFEYTSDALTGSLTQYSPYDTLTDIVCDTLGTMLASVWVGFYMRDRTIPDVVRSFRLAARFRDRHSG